MWPYNEPHRKIALKDEWTRKPLFYRLSHSVGPRCRQVCVFRKNTVGKLEDPIKYAEGGSIAGLYKMKVFQKRKRK